MHTRLLIFFIILAVTAWAPYTQAQDEPANADDSDESSERVDESEENYRRRMELEDARDRDVPYANSTFDSQVEQEKIDKLPEESQENIKDQMRQVIMESDGWKPGDEQAQYPYEPSEEAQADPELAQEEQAAWDEQIEKYHAREAAAHATRSGSMAGSGPGQVGSGAGGSNQNGPGGGGQGQQGDQSGQGGGQGGQGGGQSGSAGGGGASGTFEPYEAPDRSTADETHTAGVSESALDFLRGRPGQGGGGSQAQPGAGGGQPGSGQAGNNQPEGDQAGPSEDQLAQMSQGTKDGAGEEVNGQPDPGDEGKDAAESEPKPPSSPADPASDQTMDELLAGTLAISELEQMQGMTRQEQAAAAEQAAAQEAASQASQAQQQAQQQSESESDSSDQSEAESEPEERGILAIKDLEKLEGLDESSGLPLEEEER